MKKEYQRRDNEEPLDLQREALESTDEYSLDMTLRKIPKVGSKINGNTICVLHRADNNSYSYQLLEEQQKYKLPKMENKGNKKEMNESPISGLIWDIIAFFNEKEKI